MNKKGDAPTVVLFVVCLVLIALSLFSFITFDGKIDNQSESYAKIANEVDFAQKYIESKARIFAQQAIICDKNIYGEICKEKDIEKRFMGIASPSNYNYDFQGNFFSKIENEEFSFTYNGEFYLLEINDLFVKSERGFNLIIRNFDISFKFDKEGKRL